VCYGLHSLAHAHWLLAALLATAAAVLFGVLLDRLIYAPIQRHEGSFFTLFIASFGVAIIAPNLIGMAFGRSFVTVTTALSRSIEIGSGVFAAPLAGIAIVGALVFFGALHLFLTRTHNGVAMIVLTAPLLFPIATRLGIDPIHFAVIMVANVESATLTPPIGLNLFVMSGITKLPVHEVSRGVAPFYGVRPLAPMVISYTPPISLVLIR
jgi:branched-chain amino acid transport system permease protein